MTNDVVFRRYRFCDECIMRRVRDARRDIYFCGITGQTLHWFDRACGWLYEEAEPVTKPIPDEEDDGVMPDLTVPAVRFQKCRTCAMLPKPKIIGGRLVTPEVGECLTCRRACNHKPRE